MSRTERIAARMKSLDASGIRKVFDLAARLADPINLSIGQPDFDVPEAAKAAAIEAIRAGRNKYTQTQGTAELREAVAAACCREFAWHDPYHGAAFGDRGYLITSGVSGALLLAFLVLVDPGDEVILFDPYFVMYKHLVNLTGGKCVFVDTYPHFAPDVGKLEAAVTPRTRFILVNSPGNPAGRVYGLKEMQAIAEVARKHDLLILSDEIYELFCYDQPFVSMAAVYDNTLLMRGFSKTYAMTGWRMGWCTGPAAIIEKMTMLQQYSFVCAPSMAQAGALAAFGCDMSEHRAGYRRKRDMVHQALGETFGLVKPDGAFYAFVPAPKGMTGSAFVEKAIANNVLVIPGGVFSQRDTHFRIAYTVSDEKLARGLDILVRLTR